MLMGVVMGRVRILTMGMSIIEEMARVSVRGQTLPHGYSTAWSDPHRVLQLNVAGVNQGNGEVQRKKVLACMVHMGMA